MKPDSISIKRSEEAGYKGRDQKYLTHQKRHHQLDAYRGQQESYSAEQTKSVALSPRANYTD
jgi:hypothetical protein